MRIVVEGPDNTGKSTLIKRLQKEFALSVHWSGGPPESNEQALENCYDQFVMEDVIFDRITPISEFCYRPLDHIDDIAVHLGIMVQLFRRNSVFIYCVGEGGDHVLGEADTDEHLEYVLANEAKIKYKYEKVMSTIPHFKYDYNIHTVQEVIDYIHKERKK